MESGSSLRFGHHDDEHQGNPGAHQVFPGAGMIPATGLGALLVGLGMPTPPAMVLPGGALASAGYGGIMSSALQAAWNQAALAQQQQEQQHQPQEHHQQQPPPQAQAGGGNGGHRPYQQKGPWTEAEDVVLKEMVMRHGDRKWAVIAQSLPGRVGKQCRERWTNHLRPDLKKTVWTEEDDIALIRAHKRCGNHWSTIATFLPGRSENAVKNHWNATKRSLKAKRRLKKKNNVQQLPPGQWSVLEEYIRGLYPDMSDAPAAAAAPPPEDDNSPPSSYNNHGSPYEEDVSPPSAAAAAPPPLGFDVQTAMGLYLGAAGSSSSAPSVNNLAAMNSDVVAPFLQLDLNSYYSAQMQAMMTPMAPAPQMVEEEQQHQPASYANVITYPFVDNIVWHQSPFAHHHPHASAGAAYAGDDGAGRSNPADAGASNAAGAAAPYEVDVVQMASREFLIPTVDEVTLDLARFN